MSSDNIKLEARTASAPELTENADKRSRKSSILKSSTNLQEFAERRKSSKSVKTIITEEKRKSVKMEEKDIPAREESVATLDEFNKSVRSSGTLTFDDFLTDLEMRSSSSVEQESAPLTKKEPTEIRDKQTVRPPSESSVRVSVAQAAPRFQSEDKSFHYGEYIDNASDDFMMNAPDSVSITSKGLVQEYFDSVDRKQSEKEPKLDRALYYEMYKRLSNHHEEQKRKNNILQKKLAEYYIKKKMFHVLIKDSRDDSQARYEETLDELDAFTDSAALEKENTEREEVNLRNKCRLQKEQSSYIFEKLQQSEKEFTKQFTEGDPVKQNRIERYLRRQRIELANLVKMRLQYIRGRNMMTEKQEQLAAIVHLGPNLHLADYEQLKHDNLNLYDKFEEKEQELTKIREKCKNTMQILAHRRERTSEVNTSLQQLSEQLEDVTSEYEEAREQLNEAKRERDILRRRITRMKDDSGLLTRPLLLKDMQYAMEEVEEMSQKLEEFKNDYYGATQQVTQLRRRLSSVVLLTEFSFGSKPDIMPKKVDSIQSMSSESSTLEIVY